MSSVRLSLLGPPRRASDGLWEVDLFCLSGTLRIGDRLRHESSGNVRVEVLEIAFFDTMLEELDPVFSARVLVSGDASGWTAPGEISD